MERIDRNDIEELLFSIEHAAHAEYHLLEIMMNNLEQGISPFVDEQLKHIRETRRSLMTQLERLRPNVGPLWCTMKHLLLLHFHLFELYEKYNDPTYLKLANQTWDNIGDLLKEKKTFDNYQHCAICNQDRKSGGD